LSSLSVGDMVRGFFSWLSKHLNKVIGARYQLAWFGRGERI
jgi:hypothetical protein